MKNKPDYGIDAPGVLQGLFIGGVACLLVALFVLPFKIGSVLILPSGFYWPAGFLLAECVLWMLYAKYGKHKHRDFMLDMHAWRGDEHVLDVGCGRGLLLAGAAKRIAACGGSGNASGIDVWSNTDMGSNSAAATTRNLELEGIERLCTLVSRPAQEMPFADASFDLVVSNLCLHNIYNRAARHRALEQIARVLKPGGVAILSDYKRTGEYARTLRDFGLAVEKRHGSWLTTFPPLAVVLARKPA
ncbi:MAG: class I SAM-dependent methyltransferase [Terriglobales bacterium]